MAVENFDFDDLPENDFSEQEKTVNVTVKVSESTRKMFGKIAHRERRNMAQLGAMILEDWMNNYINEYKSTKK